MTIPVIDMVRTGENITNLRKAAGLSVHDLQKRTCTASAPNAEFTSGMTFG